MQVPFLISYLAAFTINAKQKKPQETSQLINFYFLPNSPIPFLKFSNQ